MEGRNNTKRNFRIIIGGFQALSNEFSNLNRSWVGRQESFDWRETKGASSVARTLIRWSRVGGSPLGWREGGGTWTTV